MAASPSSRRSTNWSCPQCTYINHVRNLKCELCNYPEVTIRQTEFAADQVPELDLWECYACAYRNPPDTRKCGVCLAPRRGPETPRSAGGPSFRSEIPALLFFGERTPEPEPGESWTCRCTTINDAREVECSACGGERGRVGTREMSLGIPEPDVVNERGALVVGIGMVHFRVWAPANVTRVFVAGTFNSWNDTAHELGDEDPQFHTEGRDRMGRLFSATLQPAFVGDHYKYVFHLEDGTVVWRNDPRAQVLARGDHELDSVVFDSSQFLWTDEDFEPPAFNETVIYELCIGSFVREAHGPGTFQSAIRGLDHLVRLGVNAIELMPITQDDHDNHHPHTKGCWGYDPISMFAVHADYGTPNDLKRFVNEAHSRGIAVILDWVPNHLSSKSIVVDYAGKDGSPCGCFIYPDERGFTEYGPRPDYSNQAVRKWLIDNAMMWLEDYHFDGLRVDSTHTLRTGGPGKPDLPEAWTLLQTIVDTARARFPKKILIAEDLRNLDTLNYGFAGFDSQWDQRFFSLLFHAVTQSEDCNRPMLQVHQAVEPAFLNEGISRIIYTETHDTVPADRQKRMPEAIAPGCGDTSQYAVKRSTLAAAILMTSPGIPMLLQGQEVLEVHAGAWPERPVVDWSRASRFAGVLQLYATLISLRLNRGKNTRGLLGKHVRVSHLNEGDKVIVYHRFERGGPGDDVVVVANFSNRVLSKYRIGLPRQGPWRVRCNTDDKRYSTHFDGTPQPTIRAEDGSYDMFLHHGEVTLGRYALLILSQDPL